ncbi:MAG: type IX secretion system sortase PorU [Candidatus Eisenbacteria bacterium]|nr:type IX secretion system sortase PorU [Candidatus Eisenbacteria bacterium]
MQFRFCRAARRDPRATGTPSCLSLIDALVALCLSLVVCAAFMATPSESEPLPGGPPARLIRSDQTLIEFDVIAEGTNFVTRETAAGSFEAVRIPGFFSYGRPGEAQLPHRTFLVGIPVGAAYDVTVLPLDDVTFQSKRILPAPVVSVGGDGMSEERIVPSESFYGRNESLPPSPLLGARESWMRNQRVLGIDVSPARYNPVSRILVVSTRVKVTITLRPGAVKSGAGREVQNIEAGEADGLEALYRATLVNYEPSRGWRGRRVPRPVSQLRDSFASSSNWCKLSVKGRGIYKVTGSDLRTAGVSDLGSINPLTLRLFNGGGLPLPAAREPSSLEEWMSECAIEVFDGGDGRFDDTDFILFYGMGTDGWKDYFEPTEPAVYLENSYTGTNVYWLTWDGSFVTNPEPVRIASRNGVPVTGGAYFPGYVPARLHVERNTFYDPSLAERDQRWEKWWYQALSSTASGPQSYLYTFEAPNLEPAARCSLMVRLWAPCTVTEVSCGYRHKGRIILNRQWVNEDSLYSVNSRMDLSGSGFWGQERDSLIITLGYASDVLYLAWYEFFYGKKLTVDSNSFALSSPDTTAIVRYPLNGVTDTTGLRLFDVTDYFSPVEIVGCDLQDAGGDFTLEFEDTLEAGRTKHYLLVSSAGLKSPESVVLKQFSRRLRDTENGADYVMVTHPTLAQGVQGLRSLRETTVPGIEDPATMVVLTSEIYDEFSWGLEDACALRDFIMYAYWNWAGSSRQVSYVFLVGEASYDFRNYLGTGFQNLVPAWEDSYDFYMQVQLVNDDFFVLLDGPGDVLTDVVVGRATVRTLGEARTVLDQKTVPYVNSPSHGVWRNKAIIVADDNYKLCAADELGYWHTYLSDSVAALHLPKALDKDKIYLAEFPRDAGVCYKSKAKQAFISSFDEGALIVNYIGHGSGNQLAHEQVFRLDDVGSLSNGEKLPLFFAGSCKVAKFDEPSGSQDAEGIAEKLLRQDGGGSIASVAATGLVYSDQNYDFNSAFFDFVFPGASLDSTTAIGVALQAAKNLLAVSKEDTLNARKYLLMGDPALQLAVPELEVAFDTTSADTVHLGEVVTVSGEIRDDGELAQWYDANVDLEVSGSEIVRIPGGWSPYYLPGYRFFHGSAAAEQGRFEFSFVVPVDTLILGSTGRARGYSVGTVDGTGIVSPMVIDHTGATPSDTTGPSVVLRFDNDARYVPSQSVLHVILRDEHGISITGTNASNSILLQVDKAIEPVDLTSAFVYYESSYQGGQIDYVIPTLSTGPHSVLVVAHDNLGNRGAGDLGFEIVERDTLLLKEVINYPNPFKEETYINFDLTADGMATIKIFTVSGTLIRKLCENSPARRGNNQFKWDGKDAEGDEVANGIYLYKIEVKDGEGDKDSFIGRAAVLK